MAVLLFRLAGPMQSWGTQSRFTVRDTGMEPSKSGVIGLICAALGRARNEPVDDLAALRMGIRVDKEGTMRMDYHTAGGTHLKNDDYGVIRASGKPGGTVVSNRYYLADADFLVGLEGEDIELLEKIYHGLQNPHWTLYLGRKAFVPSVPVWIPDGLKKDQSLEDALKNYPWLRSMAKIPEEKEPLQLRVVLETPFGEGEDIRTDQPVGAAFGYSLNHNITIRYITTKFYDSIPLRKEEL